MTGISPPRTVLPSLSGLPIFPTYPVEYDLDTDWTDDCDDVGAAAELIAFQKLGRAKISCVICTNKAQYSPPSVWQVLNYCFGPNSIPIAQYNGPFTFSSALANGPYTQTIAQGTWGASPGTAPTTYPGHIATVRQVWESRRQRGIKGVYVAIGTYTSLVEILQSPPDAISPLTGVQLAAAAVYLVSGQGSNDVNNTGVGPDFNIQQDPASAILVQSLLAQAGIEHVWLPSQLANGILTAPVVNSKSPISVAYSLKLATVSGTPSTRPSWDPTAVLYALLGDRDIFIPAARKITINIAADGSNTWSALPGQDTCMMLNQSGASVTELATMINSLYALAEPTIPESVTPATSNVFAGMPGLQWWIAPTDPSTVFTNNAKIVRVNDLSANGFNAGPSPDAGATPPTYVPNALNGRGVLSFNGTTDELAMDALASLFNGATTPIHIFMLVKPGSVSVETCFLSLLASAPVDWFSNAISLGQNGSQQLFFGRDGSDSAAGYTPASTAQAITPGQWTLLEASFNPVGPVNSCRVSDGTAATKTGFTPSTLNLGSARLMSKLTSGNPKQNWNTPGQVAEAAALNQIASGSTRSAMIGRMNALYGLSLPTT